MKHRSKQWKAFTLSTLLSFTTSLISPAAIAAPLQPNDDDTVTPVKHVIVIYGENRSFDHLYATYQSPSGDDVKNLLSEGIINEDGTPGPNFSNATQYQATDSHKYRISPRKTDPYGTLPPVNTGGTPEQQTDIAPPFKTIVEAQDAESDLLPRDLRLLTTGASGLPAHSIDTSIPNVNSLPNGPFQITPGIPYDAYASSPVHRFYQAWQQSDCSTKAATYANPSGCLNDLFPWVEVTIGAGNNGAKQAADFNDETTHEDATSMGFYNVAQGDMPYFKYLSDRYTISDNYHQPTMGGSTLAAIYAGFADALWYSDGKGNAAIPPTGQIEDPNPQPGTNNWYKQDGYGDATTGGGGSYSECSDPTHPGVAAVTNYLKSLPTTIKPNCDPGHYYLLNNYSAGYSGDGSVNTTGKFVLPPSPTPSIGDVLLSGKVSFSWFAGGWNQYVAEPDSPYNVYCDVCNPFQFQSKFMTDPALRTAATKDTTDFYESLNAGSLPAVSFIKPDGLTDGHPTSSKWDIFEAFTRKLLTQLKAHPDLWRTTAVFITSDEAGGYYDTGYIQPLDFFGDGPRIPLIVVSPYSTGGHVNHTYTDHVSILKFIEKNWSLPTISDRSRDNAPNPRQDASNPYVPVNSPAIGDLMDMFNFSQEGDGGAD